MTYETSGSAPSGTISPTITYGPAGSSTNGTVPMDITNTIPASPPAYYAIDIQLSDAGGSASCTIQVDGQNISTANTSGADNIATCEIVQDPTTGAWVNANNG